MRYEITELTNMVLVIDKKNNKVLVEDRKNQNWPGYTFPGGHIEEDESFTVAAQREVFEETGLHVHNLTLNGIKQFSMTINVRFMCLLYSTTEFSGFLKSSAEGKVFWMNLDDLLANNCLASGLADVVKIMTSSELSELQYSGKNPKFY